MIEMLRGLDGTYNFKITCVKDTNPCKTQPQLLAHTADVGKEYRAPRVNFCDRIFFPLR